VETDLQVNDIAQIRYSALDHEATRIH